MSSRRPWNPSASRCIGSFRTGVSTQSCRCRRLHNKVNRFYFPRNIHPSDQYIGGL